MINKIREVEKRTSYEVRPNFGGRDRDSTICNEYMSLCGFSASSNCSQLSRLTPSPLPSCDKTRYTLTVNGKDKRLWWWWCVSFTALFLGPSGRVGARRELLDFMVQGKIKGGRHTNYLDGCHSIPTNR